MSSPSARATLLALLVGPLIGALLPELWARRSDAFWARMIDADVLDDRRADALIARARPGDFDVVIAGSSIAHSGIDEALLEKRLLPRRTRAVHLAVSAASPASVAMMQRRLLAIRPRAIVYVVSRVEFSAHALTGRTRFYDPFAAARIYRADELLRYRDWHLARTFEWASVLRRRGHGFVEDALLPERTPALTARMRDMAPAWPDRMSRSIAEAAATLDETTLDDGALGARALAEMADTAQRAGIPLLIVQGPLHEVLHRPSWTHESFSGDLEDLLDKLAAEKGILRVRAADLGAFRSAHFRDATHLSASGRGRLTVAVAAALAPALNAAPNEHGLQ